MNSKRIEKAKAIREARIVEARRLIKLYYQRIRYNENKIADYNEILTSRQIDLFKD